MQVMQKRRLETLNLVAMSLHGAQAIAVLTFDRWLDDGAAPKEGKFMLRRPATAEAGWIDVRWITFACFGLSMLGQAYAAVYRRGHAGPLLRFAQHSITSGLMIMAIAVQIGLRDLYTLQGMFVLLWATQAFGLASETSQTPEQPWVPCVPLHAAGWVTCLAAFVPVMAASFTLPQQHGQQGRAIVWCEFALFGALGGAQLALLVARARAFRRAREQLPLLLVVCTPTIDEGDDDELWSPTTTTTAHAGGVAALDQRAEAASIVLTMLAKSLLGWLIMSPILVAAV